MGRERVNTVSIEAHGSASARLTPGNGKSRILPHREEWALRILSTTVTVLGVLLSVGDGWTSGSRRSHARLKHSERLFAAPLIKGSSATSSLRLPMALTREELAELDVTWGLSLAFKNRPDAYDLRLQDETCLWSEGEMHAEWRIPGSDNLGFPAETVVTARWSPAVLRVSVSHLHSVFETDEDRYRRGRVQVPFGAEAAFGDLDGDGPTMEYLFDGTLAGRARYRQFPYAYGGTTWNWSERNSGIAPGTKE